MARSIRKRGLHPAERNYTSASRRCENQLRENFSRQSSEHESADARNHVRDRQSHERRSRPGGAEREPDARARRTAWTYGVIRVVKLGGRVQSDPELVSVLAGLWK